MIGISTQIWNDLPPIAVFQSWQLSLSLALSYFIAATIFWDEEDDNPHIQFSANFDPTNDKNILFTIAHTSPEKPINIEIPPDFEFQHGIIGNCPPSVGVIIHYHVLRLHGGSYDMVDDNQYKISIPISQQTR